MVVLLAPSTTVTLGVIFSAVVAACWRSVSLLTGKSCLGWPIREDSPAARMSIAILFCVAMALCVIIRSVRRR